MKTLTQLITTVMNKISLLTAIFCLSFILCFSQNYSNISINDVTINQNIIYGINSTSLVTIFGDPINIDNDFLEMENGIAQVYNYHGAKFWLLNNKVISFKITSNNFNIFNSNLTVGQNINNLQNLFPLSFANRSNNATIINVLGHDNYIYIEFTDFNTIKSIEHRSY